MINEGLMPIKTGIEYRARAGYKVYQDDYLVSQDIGQEFPILLELVLGATTPFAAGLTVLASVLAF